MSLLQPTTIHLKEPLPCADDMIVLLVYLNDQIEDHYCHPQGPILKIVVVLKDLLCFPMEPKSLLKKCVDLSSTRPNPKNNGGSQRSVEWGHLYWVDDKQQGALK
eukprot:scaffold44957_cov61-Attheya_sp.AAC.1